MKTALLFVMAISCILHSSAWATPTPSPSPLEGATALPSDPSTISDAELAPLLDAKVAAADVIALGESVHGSTLFIRSQARLIRYLVETHQLRLVVWENPARRSQELTQWLDSCRIAKSAPPIDVIYSPIDEDIPFFTWACEFNSTHPTDPLIWRGMDIWDRSWEHFAEIERAGILLGINPVVLSTIRTDCPLSALKNWDDIKPVLKGLKATTQFLPISTFMSCSTALSEFARSVASLAQAEPSSQTRNAQIAYNAAIAASSLQGWLKFMDNSYRVFRDSWNARDAAQGHNLNLIMQQEGKKRAILVAHIGHTTHAKSPADWAGLGDIKSGIHYFEIATALKVMNIAMIGYDVTGVQGKYSVPTAPNSLDKKLHDSGYTSAFVPADAPFLAQYPKWWMQNENEPGPYESGVELVLKDHFDAYLFFDQTYVGKVLPSRDVFYP